MHFIYCPETKQIFLQASYSWNRLLFRLNVLLFLARPLSEADLMFS